MQDKIMNLIPTASPTSATDVDQITRPCHDPCVFILGCDRSGTTLVQQVLASHSQLHITYEAGFCITTKHLYRSANIEPVLEAIKGFPQYNGVDIDGLRDDFRATPGAHFQDLVALLHRRVAAVHGKTRWGDKVPAFTAHIPALALMFPAARFIHVVRDPRSVAVSWVRTHWGPNTYWHVGRRWVDLVGLATIDMDLLEPWRRFVLRYEDLVREPEPTTRKVCAFLDLDWEEGLLSAQRRERIALPSTQDEALHRKTRGELDATRAEAWRREDPRKFRHLESICWELMDIYHYEHTSDHPVPPARLEQLGYKIVNRLRGYRNAVRRVSDRIPPPKHPIEA
jgi:hypothetical protein